MAFLERVGFAAVHVFPYSRRPGTKADAMPEQLSHAVKSARAHAAQRVADDCKQRYLAQQIGQILAGPVRDGAGRTLGRALG